jgi:hypothetical protein
MTQRISSDFNLKWSEDKHVLPPSNEARMYVDSSSSPSIYCLGVNRLMLRWKLHWISMSWHQQQTPKPIFSCKFSDVWRHLTPLASFHVICWMRAHLVDDWIFHHAECRSTSDAVWQNNLIIDFIILLFAMFPSRSLSSYQNQWNKSNERDFRDVSSFREAKNEKSEREKVVYTSYFSSTWHFF